MSVQLSEQETFPSSTCEPPIEGKFVTLPSCGHFMGSGGYTVGNALEAVQGERKQGLGPTVLARQLQFGLEGARAR